MAGLAVAAQAMAAATRGAGGLVETVRGQVRGIIADCVGDLVARVPRWTAKSFLTAGVGLSAAMAEAVLVVAKYFTRIVGIVTALIASIQALLALLDGICSASGVLDCVEDSLNVPCAPTGPVMF